jgi:hypothetical protein
VLPIAGPPLILFLEFTVHISAQALFGVLAVLRAGVDIVEDRLPAGWAIHLHVDRKQLHLTAAARANLNFYRRSSAAERAGTFKWTNHLLILGMKQPVCHDLCHTGHIPRIFIAL